MSGYAYRVDEETDTVDDVNYVLKEKSETYLVDLIARLVNMSLKVVDEIEKLREVEV